MPNEGTEDAQHESKLEDHELPVGITAEKSWLTSDALDSIAGSFAGISAVITLWLGHLGLDLPAIYLGGISAWLFMVALTARANEVKIAWAVRIFRKRPGRAFLAMLVVVLICSGVVHLRWSVNSVAQTVANRAVNDELRSEIQELKETSQKTRYLLKPGLGKMPDLPELPPIVQKEIIGSKALIFLGKHVACVDRFPYTVMKQNEEPMIWIDYEDGNLLLSAKFLNKDGEVLCDIDRGVLSPQFKNIFRVDDTEAPHRLVILDNQVLPVLDIEFINYSTIRIYGYFYLRNGLRVALTEQGIDVGSISYRHFAVFRPNLLQYALDITRHKNGKPGHNIALSDVFFQGDGTAEAAVIIN